MSEAGKITSSHLSRAAVIYLLSELGKEFYQFKDGLWCAGLRSFAMIGQDEPRDLAALVVPQAGWLEHAEDPWEPYRLRDRAGAVVGPVAAFLRDLQASGRPETTLRAYAIALLRWHRFLWAAGVAWDQATRAEARDFSRWIQITIKPGRASDAADPGSPARAAGVRAGVPNPVTGKAPPGRGYAPATAAHSESVLRGFYDFHLEAGTGPMVNPFPLARGRRGRAHAHHNPMEPYRGERSGRYRPRLARRAPHHIPEEKFNELFAALGSHRDRALVAFWVSTGARASELLGATCRDADPGQQLIAVIRKGTRHLQQLPASPDAFVWLRLYQAQLHGLVPAGPDDPLWWTLRRPFRQLSYHAAYRMFARASDTLGANWSLHDLRHLAAYRMTRDPAMPLADVQWVLGHAQLATTQRYMSAPADEVITGVLAHHARMAAGKERPPGAEPPPGLRYRPESLEVLFGRPRHDHP
jgi:site-specific recombinase XerD